jgi:ABC-2 type transport system ATP-binding protein
MLEISRLSKTYRGQAQPAIDEIDLQLGRGEVLALLGPNGAGKSTCFQVIAGVLSPDRGAVRVDGTAPTQGGYQRQIGAILDSGRNIYPRLTALENATYAAVLKGAGNREARERAAKLLARLLPADKANVTVQKLSRGMQQRVSIACGIVHAPKLLILDEPTLGLDIPSTDDLVVLIHELRDEGKAILVATHQLDFAARIADQVAILDAGRILTVTSREQLRAQAQQAYSIELAAPAEAALVASLERLPGVTVQGTTVRACGESDLVYAILELVRPLPLVGIQQAGDDLGMLLRRVSHEGLVGSGAAPGGDPPPVDHNLSLSG